MRSNRPNPHVARTRRKLPGHHNRRYKGKSTQHDRKRTVDEGFTHDLNKLPMELAYDVQALLVKVEKSLAWATARLLLAVEADETVLVFPVQDAVVIEFDGFSVSCFLESGRPKARIVGTFAPVYSDEESIRKRVIQEQDKRAVEL